MKLLFVMGELTAPINATRNVALTVARGLAARGNCVTVTGFAARGEALDEALYEGLSVAPCTYNARDDGCALLAGSGGKLQKLSALLRAPRAAAYLVRRFYAKESEQRHRANLLYRRAKDLCEAQRFDWAVAVTEPYETALAVARLPHVRRAVYQIDPHANNYAKPARQRVRRMAQEQKVLRRIELALTTPEIFAEAIGTSFTACGARFAALELPCVAPRQAKELAAAGEPLLQADANAFDPAKSNLCFCGGIYGGVRSPRFLLGLLQQLGPGYCLHVYGAAEPAAQTALAGAPPGSVVLHGIVPRAAAFAAMCRADVLVNLGNSVPNQVPSKVLDAIACGKPLLNLYRVEQCPSLRILAAYPLALSVRDTGQPDAAAVSQVRSFCERTRGQTLDETEIKKRYAAFAPDYVIERVETLLRQPRSK